VKVSIKVEGLKECEEALADFMETFSTSRATGKNVVKRALINVGQPIADDAAASAPVRRGSLKAGIAAGRPLSKRQRGLHKPQAAVEVFVGAGPHPQAHLQEFGTAKHAPQPFLRPAVDHNIGRATERFAAVLKEEIEKATARAARKAARLLSRSG
jgi:HK97 gp10 family phage protein